MIRNFFFWLWMPREEGFGNNNNNNKVFKQITRQAGRQAVNIFLGAIKIAVINDQAVRDKYA